MKRLTFVISSLRSGGAERVLSILTSALAERGYEITVLSLAGDPPFYPFDHRVCVKLLNRSASSRGFVHAIRQNVERLSVLRRAIRRSSPDVVISFMDRINVLTLIASFGIRLPVIVSERTVPGVRGIGPIWEQLRRRLYPRAHAVVVQSDDAASFFRGMRHVVKIPNPVVRPSSDRPESPYPFPYIVSVGRMSEEKRFELMIRAYTEAFSPAVDGDAVPHLVLVGDGPLRERLLRLVYELRLQNRVHFTGRVSDPERYVAPAIFYLCTSRVEGFPMAVCEALALGVPVVATQCPGAIGDIVQSGVNGWLVSDQELAQTIRQAVTAAERIELGARAKEIADRYSLSRVVQLWEDLLRRCRPR